MFVPALNGAHGHGFLSAGLTGFALQGHQRGVDSGQEYSARVSVGAGDLDAGTILVAVMARPLDHEWLGDRFRFMHAALFIYRENPDGSRTILHQYSLGEDDTRFNQTPSVYDTDREYFLEQPGIERYCKIIPPKDLTYDEFVLQVIRIADTYEATGYRPILGPNSNTAATYPIREAGGRLEGKMPRTPAQCYQWARCVPPSGQMKRRGP